MPPRWTPPSTIDAGDDARDVVATMVVSGIELRDGVAEPRLEIQVTSWLPGKFDTMRVDTFTFSPSGGRDLAADLNEHALPLVAAQN
jgi:hypothetical protein